MMEAKRESTGLVVLRWAGRVWSLLSIAFLLIMFVGEMLSGPFVMPSPIELVMMLFFPLSVAIGLILAWWRECMGGLIALGGLVMFYIINTIARGGRPPRGPWLALLAAPGALFVAWWLLRRDRR